MTPGAFTQTWILCLVPFLALRLIVYLAVYIKERRKNGNLGKL